MNNERRKRLTGIVELLEEQKANLEELAAEEGDAKDNLPESFQYGEKGDAMQEAVDMMEEAVNAVDEAIVAAMEAQA
jgi:hypothetical protein